MARKKNYAPWDTPHYRQNQQRMYGMKCFGKSPNDPDQASLDIYHNNFMPSAGICYCSHKT